ncbi:hypothetical protein AZI85_15290 [Bdellovibrio bacteriovorus]|uniref:Uncharacterized protein n=1 Tax=Bdellovibrio bacteriovorus TaxID=959 RepID=A0A150WUD9_BDEBC|nr:hypothetical protein AZI85_15290 [Bdellovibrio bacteriovorus]
MRFLSGHPRKIAVQKRFSIEKSTFFLGNQAFSLGENRISRGEKCLFRGVSAADAQKKMKSLHFFLDKPLDLDTH